MVTEKHGNIFTTSCQTIVNTVNTQGFMGKGIALEMQLRFPKMCDIYKILCGVKEEYFESSQLTPVNKKISKQEFNGMVYHDFFVKYGKTPKFEVGQLWLYKGESRWILNFPTKKEWRLNSKVEYLESGLQKFVDTYKQKEIRSIAFPILGGSLGGIEESVSLNIMHKYLDDLKDIKIEIWHYDSSSPDELYPHFKSKLQEMNPDDFKNNLKNAGYSRIPLELVYEGINRENIRTMSQLMSIPKLGYETIKKMYDFLKMVEDCESKNGIQGEFSI